MATITLDDVVLEQMKTNEEIESLNKGLSNLFVQFRADRLDLLEMMREMGNKTPNLPVSGTPVSGTPNFPDTTGPSEASKLGYLTVSGITAMLTAQAAGFAAGITSSIKKLGKFTFKPFKRFIDAVDDVFGKRGTSKFLKGDTYKIFGRLTPAVRGFVDYIAKAEKFFKNLKLPKIPKISLPNIPKIEMPTWLTNFAKNFSGIFGKVFSVFRVIGRIFLPITAAIEIVTASLDEFSALGEDASWGEMLSAGIKGITKGLGAIVTVPLDLIKSAVSWLLEKMGLEKASKFLDGFSFTNLFGQLVDYVVNFLGALSAGVGAGIKALVPGGDSPAEAFQKAFGEYMDNATTVSIDAANSSGSAGAKTEAIASKTGEAMTGQGVVVVNNVNAPSSTQTNVSNTTSDVPLPQSTNSGNTRTDAYA